MYNTDADDKAEQLDIDIEQEWNVQKRRKVEHRKQMGKREKRTVISCQERRAEMTKLAKCLSSSERRNWFKEMAKLDTSHVDWANAHYAHYVTEERGMM